MERHYHEDIIDRRADELQRHMEALEVCSRYVLTLVCVGSAPLAACAILCDKPNSWWSLLALIHVTECTNKERGIP